MKDDPRAEPPEQPTTKEIPAARPEDIILAEVRNGFRAINTRLDSQDTTLETVKNEGQRTGMRLTRVEMRLDDVETRLTRNSGRVKEVSEQDAAQDAQLAQERAAREELAKKVDRLLAIGERLDKLSQKPAVKALVALITVALVSYAASKGITIK